MDKLSLPRSRLKQPSQVHLDLAEHHDQNDEHLPNHSSSAADGRGCQEGTGAAAVLQRRSIGGRGGRNRRHIGRGEGRRHGAGEPGRTGSSGRIPRCRLVPSPAPMAPPSFSLVSSSRRVAPAPGRASEPSSAGAGGGASDAGAGGSRAARGGGSAWAGGGAEVGGGAGAGGREVEVEAAAVEDEAATGLV
jgi:hypothetical protein